MESIGLDQLKFLRLLHRTLLRPRTRHVSTLFIIQGRTEQCPLAILNRVNFTTTSQRHQHQQQHHNQESDDTETRPSIDIGARALHILNALHPECNGDPSAAYFYTYAIELTGGGRVGKGAAPCPLEGADEG